MPGFVREHLRPLAGSAALHLVLIAVIGGMALRWTTSQPPVELAIEGVVVDARDLPRSVRENRAIREPTPEPAPVPKPETPPPDPAAEALKAEQQRAAEQARERAEAAERDAKREQAAEARAAAQKAAAEKAAAAKAAAEKSAAEKAAKDKAAREKAEKAAAAKAAADEARDRAAREAEVRRALAAEEEEMSAARAGAQDEYRALLSQAIERSWLKPPSARAGLACTLYVTQVPGGAVTDVRLGACNGDEAVRESIVNAVYRASPLPPPRDPRAFERRLEIVFRPKE
jgi:colicin import membrane protein